MFLRLHTVPQFIDSSLDVAVGDTFPIVDEDENLLAVIVDGYELSFSKEPDIDGKSYATWFDVVTEEG